MDTQSLADALDRACHLLDESNESIWSPRTPQEVRASLLRVRDQIRQGHTFDRRALALEFAPTSTIQEIAMSNGWHDEYLTLASIVDEFA